MTIAEADSAPTGPTLPHSGQTPDPASPAGTLPFTETSVLWLQSGGINTSSTPQSCENLVKCQIYHHCPAASIYQVLTVGLLHLQ